jgi:PhoPQ-activated pathogenicity-related protein
MKKRLASIVITMMLALSTPAQAHENIFSMMLKLHDMIHALEQVDKSTIEKAIEQSIINGIKQYEQDKKMEEFEKSQEKQGKII